MQQRVNITDIYCKGFECQESAKIQCFIHYLYRSFTDSDYLDGKISISKKYIDSVNLNDSDLIINDQHEVYHDNTTISEIKGVCHVEFANEFIGGLIYRGGCVQEEIEFCIHPECLISMLFCTRMEENQTIHFQGCEQFSKYEGYGRSFSYLGDYKDPCE